MTDPSGHPVPNLLVGISVRTEATVYIVTRDLPEARLRSDADGLVTFPWFPPEFRYVDVDLFDDAALTFGLSDLCPGPKLDVRMSSPSALLPARITSRP